jgi:hypothetical protein
LETCDEQRDYSELWMNLCKCDKTSLAETCKIQGILQIKRLVFGIHVCYIIFNLKQKKHGYQIKSNGCSLLDWNVYMTCIISVISKLSSQSKITELVEHSMSYNNILFPKWRMLGFEHNLFCITKIQRNFYYSNIILQENALQNKISNKV